LFIGVNWNSFCVKDITRQALRPTASKAALFINEKGMHAKIQMIFQEVIGIFSVTKRRLLKMLKSSLKILVRPEDRLGWENVFAL
jgi:hypothetical protein